MHLPARILTFNHNAQQARPSLKHPPRRGTSFPINFSESRKKSSRKGLLPVLSLGFFVMKKLFSGEWPRGPIAG
jgi:hypothetical protein